MIAVPPEVFLYEMEELAMKFVKKLLAVVLAGNGAHPAHQLWNIQNEN